MAEFLTPDICVIGGGAAGLAVARQARARGASVVLVEPGQLGGEALHAASVPARALAAAARRAHLLRTAEPFGIAAGEPRISARGVFDHVHETIAGIAPTVTAEQVRAHGIDLIAAPGRFLDRQSLAAGDRTVRARRFVIATGSHPLVPDIPGLGEVPYFTSRSFFDNTRKLTHLVIIGAGETGLELAQACRRLGAAVTVIERATPLGGRDPELVAVALRRLADEGVVLRAATEVVAVQQRSLGIGVAIRSAAGEETLDASHVLVATGRAPALEGLELEHAGIKVRIGDGPVRLLLQDGLRTSNPRVYAVGDAAGLASHVQAARRQAELVVRQTRFGLPERFDPSALPVAVFTDPEIAEVGLTEPMARLQRRGDFEVRRLGLAENDRARIERQGYGLVKLVIGRGGRLLGAGIVGTGAAETISLFALAIANGLSLRHLARFVAPYPTLGEVAGALAGEAPPNAAERPLPGRLGALRRVLP